MSSDELLEKFDSQMRRDYRPSEPGWRAERDPRITAVVGPPGSYVDAAIIWSGLDDANADEAVAEQKLRFAGKSLEWKLYAHDLPADLGRRLEAAGFLPEMPESLMVAETSLVVDRLESRKLDADLTLRRVQMEDDLEALCILHTAVWGDDSRELFEEIGREQRDDPSALEIWLVEPYGGEAVACAWLRLHSSSEFASLWGGSTHPLWRRRGVYQRLVSVRARRALDAGFRYLQVDASAESRPILEKLGFAVLDSTIPYQLDQRQGA